MLFSGVQQSDLLLRIHVSILFQIIFPFRLLKSIEQSFLCCMDIISVKNLLSRDEEHNEKCKANQSKWKPTAAVLQHQILLERSRVTFLTSEQWHLLGQCQWTLPTRDDKENTSLLSGRNGLGLTRLLAVTPELTQGRFKATGDQAESAFGGVCLGGKRFRGGYKIIFLLIVSLCSGTDCIHCAGHDPWVGALLNYVFRHIFLLLKYCWFTVLCPYSQSYGFSSSHIPMWVLEHKEGWATKNWCFRNVVLENTLESPLDCKETEPVNPKGNQPWIFIGRTDAEVEAPVLWPPDPNSQLIEKDLDAWKDWEQQEKGATEDEMVGWHHGLNEHEFE